ncbi:potassium transporter Trk [Cytobacillus sp. Sa5YUA1]|uniref:precorrin-2 dehydrogenase n=1 Tax=Cytobacillus stercorigallinarum TaxID=2762240 RepID=A0ABR8QM10_9BACI|nr:NAD(P)-dependent oxidoreductase [Cytobacillus stercorigallinarum]MBD7936397.1 potassium transporter Trk [Cytobacillus stercorigallinarum]
MQPLVIDLSNQAVVIAGGGKIAARKAKVLLEQRANITFIAPTFSDEVLELAQHNQFQCIKREVELADFEDVFLCILATNNRAINKHFGEILTQKKLVCVVDELTDGNTLFPATVTRGHLQVAVTSNGSSPKLTRALKQQLSKQFDESWTEYTTFLAEYRQLVKKLPISESEKNDYLQEVLTDECRLNKEQQRESLEALHIAAVRSTEGKI